MTNTLLEKIKEHGKETVSSDRAEFQRVQKHVTMSVASKASPRLPLKDVTMYQEKLASFSGKMLIHSIDSIAKVT